MAHRTPTLALCAALALFAGPGLAAAETAAAPAAAPNPSSKAPARPVKRAAKRPAPSAPAAAAADGSYQLVPSGGSALTRARSGSFGTLDDSTPPPGYRKRGSVGIGLGGANGTTPGMSLGF